MRVALVRPPNVSNFVRGSGVYYNCLLKELRLIDDLEIVEKEFNFFEYGFEKFDLIHYAYFDPFFLTLPIIKSSPRIVTIYDLTPIVLVKHYPRGLKGNFKWLIQQKLVCLSDRIITISKNSKKDIEELIGISADRVDVTILASGIQEKKTKYRHEYNLPKRYFLYVGDVNFNKNLSTLVKSFSFLTQNPKYSDVELIMLGASLQNESIPETKVLVNEMKELNLFGKIHRLRFVDTADQIEIYNNAKALVFPSLYEGFGLPIVEAMSCGCPVICGDNSSIREVAGDVGMYCNISDPISMLKTMEYILEKNSQDSQNLKNKSVKQSAKFSWSDTAKKTYESYLKVLEHSSERSS